MSSCQREGPDHPVQEASLTQAPSQSSILHGAICGLLIRSLVCSLSPPLEPHVSFATDSNVL